MPRLSALSFVFALALAAAPASAQRAPLAITALGEPMTVTLTGPDGVAVPCNTPCDLAVEPGSYQLEARARGLRTVQATLTAGSEPARWALRSGTSAAFTWGGILTAFGASALGLSAGFVTMALTSAPGDSYNEMMATIMGTMGGLIGGVSLALGIVLIASNVNGVEVSLAPAPGGATAGLRLRM